MKEKFLSGKIVCYGFTGDKVNSYVHIDKKLSIEENFKNNRIIESIVDNNGVYFRGDYNVD